MTNTENSRVNISYGVNLQDIPTEVSRLLTNATNSLQKGGLKHLQEVQATILRDKNYAMASEKVDEVRRTLGQIDHLLHDCYGILLAYRELMLKQDSQQMNLDLSEPETTSEEFNIDSLLANPNFEKEAMKIAEKMRQQTEEVEKQQSSELMEASGHEKG